MWLATFKAAMETQRNERLLLFSYKYACRIMNVHSETHACMHTNYFSNNDLINLMIGKIN